MTRTTPSVLLLFIAAITANAQPYTDKKLRDTPQNLDSVRIDIQNKLRVINKEMDSLKLITLENRIAKDWYSSLVTIQTAAFSAAVAILVMFLGLVTYTSLRIEFKRKVQKIEDELEIKYSRIKDAFKIVEVNQDISFYVSHIALKAYADAMLFALRIAKQYAEMNEAQLSEQWLDKTELFFDDASFSSNNLDSNQAKTLVGSIKAAASTQRLREKAEQIEKKIQRLA